MNRYVLLGGGGFALELYTYIKDDGGEVVGYYAPEESVELKNLIEWLGDERLISPDKLCRDAEYLIAARLIKIRLSMIEFIKKNNLKAGTFIHSEAFVSSLIELGKGAVAFPRAMLTGNAKAGDFLFADSLSIISHGDVIGNNVVIGPAATICGDCNIGDNCSFGVNSAVLPGTRIGSNSEITIGTFPRKIVDEGSTIVSKPGVNIGIALNKNFN